MRTTYSVIQGWLKNLTAEARAKLSEHDTLALFGEVEALRDEAQRAATPDPEDKTP